jgi:peptide/nickel transport system permease protein
MARVSDRVADAGVFNTLLQESITPAFRRFLSWGLVVWIGYLVAVSLFAATGSELAPYDPTAQQVLARLMPPLSSSSRGFHWLGTDQLGRDLCRT